MPTVVEILNLAPAASYLAANANDKNAFFKGGILNPLLPSQIYAGWFILSKIYSKDPTFQGLEAAANYLWELMGRYGVQAQSISGSGGSVSPITPILTPDPIHFEVSASSLIPSGGSTLNLSAYGYRGFGVLLVVNNLPLSTINLGAIYYSWDTNTAILTILNGTLNENDLVDIYPI